VLQKKYTMLRSRLDEHSLRLCAATEAMALGRGGPSLVAKAGGLSRATIYAGLNDLKEPEPEVGTPSESKNLPQSKPLVSTLFSLNS